MLFKFNIILKFILKKKGSLLVLILKLIKFKSYIMLKNNNRWDFFLYKLLEKFKNKKLKKNFVG